MRAVQQMAGSGMLNPGANLRNQKGSTKSGPVDARAAAEVVGARAAPDDVVAAVAAARSRGIPRWLELDDQLKAKVVALPLREDVSLPVSEKLIVEPASARRIPSMVDWPVP